MNEFKLTIQKDFDTPSPRGDDYENLATLVSSHRKLVVGDDNALDKLTKEIRSHKNYKDSYEYDYDFQSVKAMQDLGEKIGLFAVTLPLYIYTHSGSTISTTPFSCSFDSGQYGFAYITKDEAYSFYDIKRITKVITEKLEQIIKDEVSVFNSYINGDFYYFNLFKINEIGEAIQTIDSCGGFQTADIEKNGMKDEISEEYHYLIPNAEMIS